MVAEVLPSLDSICLVDQPASSIEKFIAVRRLSGRYVTIRDKFGPFICGACRATFGRPQELARHTLAVHCPPRQCPFCPYQWRRPYKIKAHIIDVHQDEFPQEVWSVILLLRHQDVVTFVDTLSDVSITTSCPCSVCLSNPMSYPQLRNWDAPSERLSEYSII